MAEIKIETYRGWEITFHLHNETFSTYNNHYDKEFSKPTLSAVKKQIDDYLKINQNFEKIKVMQMGSIISDESFAYIVGVRKDKNFTIDRRGKKQQLSEYDEKNWFLYDHENEPVFEKIREIKEKIDKLQDEKKELEAQVKKVTVKDIKKELIEKYL